ncbi:hypothetical protein J1614_004683 [Plenodomus biglobosus]|nr:hypothetical protein J1614_004683 [Plenodomus biglobosus]
MSTLHLTIHDLLRITYTYEAQAHEAAARSRSNSVCSTPETCSHLPTTPSAEYTTLETDYTQKYCRKSRRA